MSGAILKMDVTKRNPPTKNHGGLTTSRVNGAASGLLTMTRWTTPMDPMDPGVLVSHPGLIT